MARAVKIKAGEMLRIGFSMVEDLTIRNDVGEYAEFQILRKGGSYRIRACPATAKKTQHLPIADVKIGVSE